MIIFYDFLKPGGFLSESLDYRDAAFRKNSIKDCIDELLKKDTLCKENK